MSITFRQEAEQLIERESAMRAVYHVVFNFIGKVELAESAASKKA